MLAVKPQPFPQLRTLQVLQCKLQDESQLQKVAQRASLEAAAAAQQQAALKQHVIV